MAEFQTNSNAESYFQSSQYNNIISENESMIQFDNEDVLNDFIDSKKFILNVDVDVDVDPKLKFGIIKLKINKIDPIRKKRHIVFTVDCSGSMSELCNDGRSKMEHINHTLTNMISYFAEQHLELLVSISVFAFDDIIYKIIENEDVTQDNLDNLVQNVKKIRPRNMTDIEKALLNSREYILTYCDSNIDTEVTHIFMTDGDATQGKKVPDELKEFVSPLVSNIFIGFGIDHNAYLLKMLACENNNSYYLVDALEKAGLVYGEILHSIIYKILENVSVYVTNGYIYDWKKNSWVTNIAMEDLVSDNNKILHVVSRNPSEFTCSIHCRNCITKDNFVLDIQNTVTNVTTVTNDGDGSVTLGFVDLTKYKYRQKTQQLLFDVNLHNFNKNKYYDHPANLNLSYDVENEEDSESSEELDARGKVLKNKMTELLKQLFPKVAQNEDEQLLGKVAQNEDELFMKMLCDDIYVCLQTFETRHGAMFSCARQASQGAQRSYSANYTPTGPANKPKKCNNGNIGNIGPPRLMRSYAMNYKNCGFIDDCDDGDNGDDVDNCDDDNADDLVDHDVFRIKKLFPDIEIDTDDADADEFTEYKVSDQIDTPYSNLSVLSLMRACSASTDDNKLFR